MSIPYSIAHGLRWNHPRARRAKAHGGALRRRLRRRCVHDGRLGAGCSRERATPRVGRRVSCRLGGAERNARSNVHAGAPNCEQRPRARARIIEWERTHGCRFDGDLPALMGGGTSGRRLAHGTSARPARPPRRATHALSPHRASFGPRGGSRGSSPQPENGAGEAPNHAAAERVGHGAPSATLAAIWAKRRPSLRARASTAASVEIGVRDW
jgi:hypothetical protein